MLNGDTRNRQWAPEQATGRQQDSSSPGSGHEPLRLALRRFCSPPLGRVLCLHQILSIRKEGHRAAGVPEEDRLA
jgi:hypothetical protein